jgi:type I restriction-modification system DNA methylase subunit
MGYGHGIKIARSTLGYLAMEDELKNRMELAHGEIRALGSSSKTADTTKKNQKKVGKFDRAFGALQDNLYEPRELEILAEKLAGICADIIEDNTKFRQKR